MDNRDDATRVVLNKLPDDDYSDYINANYIDGYNAEKFYIAAQGPKPNTVDDFWRMVWQERVQVIVMMTNVVENGQNKCEQYWPGLGKEMVCGRIDIFTSNEELFADYAVRTLNVMFMGNTRKVRHMQFTSWPSCAVPIYPQSMVTFLAKLQELPQDVAPFLVHCSAGFGRTGATILADICLRMAEAEGAVDVLHYLQMMRQQRANMVDSKEQYILVHIVLVESLVNERTCYPWNKHFLQHVTHLKESGSLAKQFRDLEKVHPWDLTVKSRTNSIQAMMQMVQHRPSHKDRFPDIIPGPQGAVKISRFPAREATSEYINAVYVDGFRIKDLFIVTQLPIVNTVGDFWRMVYEKNISLIVMLNEMDLSDEDLDADHRFLPSSSGPTTPMPYLKISLVQQSDMLQWSLSKYLIENIKKTKLQKVRLIRVKGWSDDWDTPEDPGMLIELWREVETYYSGKGSIVVTCLDGARACGLFVAMAFLIEKIKLEQQCDVCQAVRIVRHNRKQFIRSQGQFDFLYLIAVELLSSFQHYSNFDSE